MKKIIALLLVVCFGLMFTACDVVEEPTHVCEFVAEWSTDETHHWHACKDESCTLIDGKEEHLFSWVTDKEPTVTEQGEKHEECECGLKKSEGTAIEKLGEEPAQPDKNQVTEEEFYSAIKFEGITSFSCDGYSLAPEYDDDLNPIGTHYYENKMFVKNNIALFTYDEGWEAEPFSEIYVEVLEGRTYEYFELVGFGMVRADVTDTVESLGMPLLPSPEFWEEGFIERSRIDYDDFTYSDGQYVGTMKADIDDDTLIDTILKFENGKLVYARFDYKQEGYDCYSINEFHAFNQTEVTLPTVYTEI
ncbi:MAG: hypothetical protein IJD54_01145 [Clostridia bacterium]|nr:hypothetical protein [Clostridia bacterium]